MSRVIVVGGGITGAGIARDLSLRGIDVTLVERGMPASGATGRCHGLLHSGARYAVSDPVVAAECAVENRVLRSVARQYVEDTGGLFLATSAEEASYGDKLLEACRRTGIPMEDVPVAESPNPSAIRCLQTNDAGIDPFLLTLANLYDAERNGARIMTGIGVRAVGEGSVKLDDGRALKCDVAVNAAGHEFPAIQKNCGMHVQPDKGTILVTERRVCDVVLNRMRPPSDGDIIVPGHTTSLIGTTSAQSISTSPTRDEFRALMREASALLPSLKGVRVIRAFSGIRPLIGIGDGRSLSRDYRIEGEHGIITVAGGKLTTYRLIAEMAADAAMRLLGERGECKTRSPLPSILRGPGGDILCNCEQATDRLVEMDFLRPEDAWKFNRIGFGACQGMRCARNAARGRELLEERWKGVKPVLDDIQMKQSYLSWASYMSLMEPSQ
jgi:glycerol-3-phosphate dehydrogenase